MNIDQRCLPEVQDRHSGLWNRLAAALKLTTREAIVALLCATNVFVLLASYYVLKTVREALILSEAGAAVKSYAAAGQVLVFLVVLPVYSAVTSKVTRSRLVTYVTLFFVSHLGVFYFLGENGVRIGIPFFLWVGVFNVLVIAQFWAFAGDLYDIQSGTRVFPIIGIGSALGACCGAWICRLLVAVDIYPLMLVAAAGLLSCVLLSRLADAQGSHNTGWVATEKSVKGGLRLVLSDRYLCLIALMVLLLNFVNSLGEYMLGEMVVANAKAAAAAGIISGSQIREMITSFYAGFFGWVNLATLVLQALVVSRLFDRVGVQGAMLIVPTMVLGAYSLTAVLPVLAVVRIAKVLENSSDYSIQNTARHALFLPMPPQEKYKTKAAIDTFFWRLGDMLQAGFILAGANLGLTIRQYAVVNMVLAAAWLLVAIGIWRLSPDSAKQSESVVLRRLWRQAKQ
jgi:AAA family ATP:ADP antiporter